MILEDNSLIVSKELDFTFEEMISLEIALINKGRLLPSHKLEYDQEGNIRVCYTQQTNLQKEIYSKEEEEEIIDSFLTEYGDSDEDSQSIQSIPQNCLYT